MVCGYKLTVNKRAVSMSALASFQYTATRIYAIGRALFFRCVCISSACFVSHSVSDSLTHSVTNDHSFSVKQTLDTLVTLESLVTLETLVTVETLETFQTLETFVIFETFVYLETLVILETLVSSKTLYILKPLLQILRRLVTLVIGNF